jgi:uncharacterized phage protein gp47/JayE
MSYGVVSTGFNLKRFEDIKAEIEEELRVAFGEIDTDADSVFGQIIGVFSRHLAEIWEQAENVYNAMYPNSAEGVNLDNAASLVAIRRLTASSSTAIVQMLGDEATVVPIATTFSQELTSFAFETLEAVTISATKCHKVKITVDNPLPSTTYTITINGFDCTFVSPSGSPTSADIATGLCDAVNANIDVSSDITATYVATTDYITIIINDININIIFTTVVTNLDLTEIWTPVAVEALDTGANPVPIGSINSVLTPVFGLNEITNLSEGVTGRNVETDAELRIRRRNSLNIVGAGTLDSIVASLTQDLSDVTAAFGFENNTDSVDIYGRPPHSFEIVVAALDITEINQLIADKIWEKKPAGITTYGTTSMTVVDSNGDNQIVSFSHSINKYVHVKLEYSKTGSDQVFPTNGEDIIKDAVMTLGQEMTFGSDLLIQRFAACGYAAGGVTSVIAYLAVTNNPGDIPSWQTTNISIQAADYPSFDESRITLVVI